MPDITDQKFQLHAQRVVRRAHAEGLGVTRISGTVRARRSCVTAGIRESLRRHHTELIDRRPIARQLAISLLIVLGNER